MCIVTPLPSPCSSPSLLLLTGVSQSVSEWFVVCLFVSFFLQYLCIVTPLPSPCSFPSLLLLTGVSESVNGLLFACSLVCLFVCLFVCHLNDIYFLQLPAYII